MEFLPQLHQDSKLWFYLSPRKFNAEEGTFVTENLQSFVSNWKAHGTQLTADFQVINQQIILIGVNEAGQNATGCSIDSQVHFIKNLGAELKIDFFNRQLLAIEGAASFEVISFEDLAKGVESGKYSDNSKVLNHLETSLAALRSSGVAPLKDSWHNNLV